jgi:hypothetical protein
MGDGEHHRDGPSALGRSAFFALAILACGVVGFPSVAHADDPSKEACIAASERADQLRRGGKLQGARADLLVCIAKSCPRIVRDDCMEQLDALDKAIPTIVFTAKDGEVDMAAVSVTMDGAPLADRIDGTPLSVDPGEHTFEFTAEGRPKITKKLVISEGVKNRQELVVFVASEKASGTDRAAPTARLVVMVPSAATVALDGSVAGSGRFEGSLSPGSHGVRVTEPGKRPYVATIELRDGETRTIEPNLEEEHRRSIVPWVIGGAVLVAGAIIGGYFLLSSQDQAAPPVPGKLGSGTLSFVR